MKVAYIGHKPAYPKLDGGCVASAAFLNNLIDANCEVTYAMLSTDKHPFNEKAFPEDLRNAVKLHATSINTKVNVFGALLHLFKRSSYNVERFYSKNFERQLSELIQHNEFDAVIFDNVFAARYLKVFRSKGIPTYVRTHNAEYSIWETLAASSKNRLKKWYLQRLAKDLKAFEIKTLQAVDGILSITKDDLYQFQAAGITTKSIYIPVSVESTEYIHNYSNAHIFHFGAMNWLPNIQAVDALIRLLPAIQERIPGIQFTIAGRNASLRFDDELNRGIFVADNVSSIPEFLQAQGILISPITSGSGVRIKILEMMAYGVPIITTTLGAQGIEDTSGLIIADTDTALVEAIYELATDENKRKELGNQARTVVSLYHNPSIISQQIVEFLQRT